MNLEEKEITFVAKNSYATLNHLTEQTKNVWLVFHGMGYLSRYFLKYFKDLNPEENYIVAPQAPSKYYIQPKMHVGANWLTRDNTAMGMASILSYLDVLFDAESIPEDKNLIVFGYSQGVSIATRFAVKRQLQCNQLVLHSGGIPKELNAEDFEYLNTDCNVKLIYGTQDEFLNAERVAYEEERAKALFGERLEILPFEGKHIVNVDYVNKLV
ncbi:MAG: esterase [Winogradskyella sp.]|uniref:alpha/beta hydrolase n=1 Tax=Winogradskyella sp. TaxID=1883156 RepID=UPI000F3B0C03|nr:esterase [Winogradskyella sp.]RNC87090.1 MAG: esterase [Winogradskyella sp.]